MSISVLMIQQLRIPPQKDMLMMIAILIPKSTIQRIYFNASLKSCSSDSSIRDETLIAQSVRMIKTSSDIITFFLQICILVSFYIIRVITKLIIMDKAARLVKIDKIALAFRQKHPELIGQHVKVVEVGPRDGLQNEKKILSLEQKLNLINRLSKTGLKTIQVGSFVSPKWIPQMANSLELFQKINKVQGISYPCLVPNTKGMETALQAGIKQIAIFASATQGFSQKNLNCSIQESLKRFEPVMTLAQKNNILVRGYVSMVMGCPFDGQVKPQKVSWVAKKLLQMGCYEVSLGDTIGRGTILKTQNLFKQLSTLPSNKLAAHFHDTFDTAIQNILTAVSFGCRTVDSSVGGLGGCPYSMKPVGNVCTENVVYALEKAGFQTGVNLVEINQIGKQICEVLNRPSLSIL